MDYRSADVLNRLYIQEGHSMTDIAKMFRVDPVTIRNWMIKRDIPIRSVSAARLTKRFQESIAYGRSEYCNPEVLRRLYVDEGLTGTDIAVLAGVDRHTVVDWLRGFGIPVRSSKECKKAAGYLRRMSGESHPNFKEGKRTLYSGSGYKTLQLYGEERKKHRCNRQGRVPEHIYVMENYIGRPLTRAEVVHHIDFDRLNNGIENLILFPNQRTHNLYHKWLERVGQFHLGIIPKFPIFEFPQGVVVGTQT